MRVGVTQSSVYVAPRKRRSAGNRNKRRPNLANLLQGRALDPALEANEHNVEQAMERLLDKVADTWENA
jgi:hypothetical protein